MLLKEDPIRADSAMVQPLSQSQLSATTGQTGWLNLQHNNTDNMFVVVVEHWMKFLKIIIGLP